MFTEHLAPLKSRARELVEFVVSNRRPNSAWQVIGPPAVGKSFFTGLFADELARRLPQVTTIKFAAPEGAIDSGASSFLSVAAQLKAANKLNGSYDDLCDPGRTFDERLRILTSGLAAASDDIIVVFDAPESWAPAAGGEHHRFSSHARRLFDATAELPMRRVVVSSREIDSLVADRYLRIKRHCEPERWMLQGTLWGELGDTAAAVFDLFGHSLADRPPLEIKLLVACASVSSLDDVAGWFHDGTARRTIADCFIEALKRQTEFDRFKRAWGTVARLRGPFGRELLKSDDFPRLSEFEHDLLLFGLLYEDHEAFVLHETLRHDALRAGWLHGPDETGVHAFLGEYYRSAFVRAKQQNQVVQAISAETEAFHHLCCAGVQRDDIRPYFTDQLDSFGRELSFRHQRYTDAAEVFERSIAYDDRNDYAHHYVAFNCDIEGLDAAKVERHYLKAIELAPDNVWWRSRYICFLVTRGRARDAREAWDEALERLGLPDDSAPTEWYESLHLWVARLLIHRGRFAFAQEVLDGIPKRILGPVRPGLYALRRRLEALVTAQMQGAFFPLFIPQAEWWKGPHLAQSRNDAGAEIERWLAGRVECVEDGVIHCSVAESVADTPEGVRTGDIEFTFAQFDTYSRDDRANEIAAGRFIELVYYTGSSTPVIRVHRSRSVDDTDLPPLRPDPVRYLRQAGMVR